MRDSLSFAKYAMAAVSASPILTDVEVETALAIVEGTPYNVMLYCARIAAHVADELRSKTQFLGLDDTDYIDAAQECSLYTPNLVITWRKTDGASFSAYAAQAFRNIAREYLSALTKGGMGSGRSAAQAVTQIPADAPLTAADDSGDEIDTEGDTYSGDTPMGLGDPLEALITQETVESALKTLETPIGDIRKDTARGKRVLRQLG